MKRLTIALAVLLAGLGTSCVTPSETAEKPARVEHPDEDADQLRDKMSRAPDDPKRVSLQDELARIELNRARQANTVLGYRRFLEEFPHGDESDTARVLLEELEFRDAQSNGTAAAWIAFLEEQPRGKHAIEGRTALGNLQINVALASNDVVVVRQTLGQFPDHPRADVLRVHEDDLAFALAIAALPQGTDELDAYLAQHPDGVHRAEALRKRGAAEALTLEESEDLARAKALAARSNATETNRAVVAAIELRRAMRNLDLAALRKLAETKSTEPTVHASYQRAAEFIESLKKRPIARDVQEAIDHARPGAGLPTHQAVVDAISMGDPIDRVSALRELAEWADPDDVRTALSALPSEYVDVRLQAVHTLRSLAMSLEPAVWKELEKSRESDVLSHELSAATWRQLAALRDADGRNSDAAAGWRAAAEADANDLAARARTFQLARESGDRLALGAAARELAKAAVTFSQERWSPRQNKDPNEQRGRLLGLPGGQTTLRQLCAAIDLGGQAAQALGELSQKAAPEEQQLLLLAKRDADQLIDSIRLKRQELEASLQLDHVAFAPCGADPSAKAIEASRVARAAAILRLGELGDERVTAFVEGLAHTPSPQVRAAVTSALAKLSPAKH